MEKMEYYYDETKDLLGKVEEENKYLFQNGKWILDNQTNTLIQEKNGITKEKANLLMAKQTVSYLKKKWKKEFASSYEKWKEKPGWPAKYVETQFELYGIPYTIYPNDIGADGDGWGQGFMEAKRLQIEKDLEEVGAKNIHSMGFLD